MPIFHSLKEIISLPQAAVAKITDNISFLTGVEYLKASPCEIKITP